MNNISGYHIAILGFVYAFGYFVPTVFQLKNNKDKPNWLPTFFIRNLTLDLIFTILFSAFLLKRKFIQNAYDLIVPGILCILSVILSGTVVLT